MCCEDVAPRRRRTVRATKLLWYAGVRRSKGTIFTLAKAAHFKPCCMADVTPR